MLASVCSLRQIRGVQFPRFTDRAVRCAARSRTAAAILGEHKGGDLDRLVGLWHAGPWLQPLVFDDAMNRSAAELGEIKTAQIGVMCIGV